MLTLSRKEVGGTVLVDVEGNLTGGAQSGDFHDFIKAALGEGRKRIVVNLQKVPWANSLGIGMLIGAFTSTRNAGGELVLTQVSDRINSVLITTQLYRIFKAFDTNDEAVSYLTEHGELVDQT